MKFGRILLVVVDVLFMVAEAVSGLANRKRDKGKDLTAADLLERKDADLRRRTTAKTVVIPPPSERERTQRR